MTQEHGHFSTWEDWEIEGYWKVADMAEKLNTESGMQERSERCKALRNECETELFKRWKDK